MTVRFFSLVLALAATLAGPALAGQDSAARLSAVKGDVRISGETGLVAAGSGKTLKAGDRLVARTGSAQVRYADGCVITVPAGAMATIGKASPCASGPGLINPGSSAALSIPGLSKLDTAGYFAVAGVAVLGASLIVGLVHETSP